MIAWTVAVPLKLGPDRKSRLSTRLSLAERTALSERMASHVIATVRSIRSVTECLLLATAGVPAFRARWVLDEGRGLNAELDALRRSCARRPLLILHADLPLLDANDIVEMLEQAERAGSAIAPDRHGTGTNALALTAGKECRFAFGPGSFFRHHDRLGDGSAIIRRRGLALDVDAPGDLEEVVRINDEDRRHANIVDVGLRPTWSSGLN